MKKRIVSFLCGAVLLFLTACAGGQDVSGDGSETGSAVSGGEVTSEMAEVFAMNTVMNLTVYSENPSELLAEAKELIFKYENLFSVNVESSDVARLNRAGGQKVTVSPETYDLIQRSVRLSEQTDGLFDISIYPLVRAWGFTAEDYRVPDAAERARLSEQVDYRKIKLGEGNAVTLAEHMQIDLGGIAKGYLSQELINLFREKRAVAAVISLGGNVQTYGQKPGGDPFVIGITDPGDGVGMVGTVEVEETAVVTSGSYQRYFERDGVVYHHIMDKRTGAPAQSDLASVTVLTGDGVAADGLATALFVMGKERAIAFDRENSDIRCVLVDVYGQVWVSDGVRYREQ